MFRSARFRLWLLVVLTVAVAFLFWGLPHLMPQPPMAIEFVQGKDLE